MTWWFAPHDREVRGHDKGARAAWQGRVMASHTHNCPHLGIVSAASGLLVCRQSAYEVNYANPSLCLSPFPVNG